MSDMLNIFLDGETHERKCTRACIDYDVSCPNTECRHWISHEEDLNCTLVCVDKHEDGVTLREVGERLGISFVRVCQIEKKAIQKLKKRIEKPVSIK
jgi:hypothetical protein